MNININNYESYYIDYIEENLCASDAKEFELFLEKNPELKNEFAYIPLIPTLGNHFDSSSLKKLDFENSTINSRNFEDYCVANFENILNENKKTELTSFIHLDDIKQNTYNQYEKVYLKPNKKIKFYSKKQLYRRTNIFTIRNILKVAATVSLLIITYSIYQMTFVSNIESNNVNNIANIIINQNDIKTTFIVYQPKTKEIAKEKSKINKVYTLEQKPKDVVVTLTPIQDTTEQEKIEFIETFIADNNVKPIFEEEITEPEVVIIESMEKINISKIEYLKQLPKKVIAQINQLQLPYISMMNVLKLGVNQVGDITPFKMKMKTVTDTTGAVTAYSIEAGKWKYYAEN